MRPGATLFAIVALLAALFASAPARADVDLRLTGRLCNADKVCGVKAVPSTARTFEITADLSDAPVSATRDLSFVSRDFLFESMAIEAIYADGARRWVRVEQAQAATHWIAGARFAIPLPSHDSPVVGLRIIVERAHEMNLLAESRLMDNEAIAAVDRSYLVLFAMLIGITVVPLVYNLALYPALRNNFQLSYAGMAVAALAYGAAWSNLVFVALPDLPFLARYVMTHLGIAAAVFFNVLFLTQFVEAGVFSARVKRGLLFAAAIPCGFAVYVSIVLADVPAWFNAAHHLVFQLTTIAMFIGCAIAIKRRSIYIWYFLAGWTGAYLTGVPRTLRTLGLIEQSYVVDGALFVAFTLESFIVALGIAHRVIAIRRERDESLRREAELTHRAETDALTGLLDRRAFSDRIAERGADEGVHALILVDIDHFKSVNDSYGHDGGDRVLRGIARLFRAAAPAGSLSARLGGEEFALFVSGAAAAETARRVAGELRHAVNREVTQAANGEPIHITVSIGVAVGRLDATGAWQSLYVAADSALYCAKKNGRDRIEWAGENQIGEIAA